MGVPSSLVKVEATTAPYKAYSDTQVPETDWIKCGLKA